MAKMPSIRMDMFRGRTLIIATQHGKEQVISPELEKQLGVKCEVITGLDTNQFGTFSGEVKREGTALEAAQKKAQAALALSTAPLVVASEGSFGPHPYYSFIPGNEELLLFIDKDNHLEIVARHLTTETNYAQRHIESVEEWEDFCEQVGFPSHGIILKATHPEKPTQFFKDLLHLNELISISRKLMADGYLIHAETDMRAMRNPTRMKAIEVASQRLVELLKSACPSCQAPGYAKTAAIEGLPCTLCGSPTRSAKAYIYTCSSCQFNEEVARIDKKGEDPMYCDVCNP